MPLNSLRRNRSCVFEREIDARSADLVRGCCHRHPRAHFPLAAPGAGGPGVGCLAYRKGRARLFQGPSGSANSTLLSLLAGVTVPQRGELRVLGRRLDQLGGVQRDHFWAHHIGYIFQMFNLIPYRSMVDNVALPCRFSKAHHDKALQRSPTLKAEAERLLEHLDMAHAELLHRPMTTLSVGQQQRT